MMFDFFTRHTAKDLVENAKELYNMPLPNSPAAIAGEHFRVGATRFGETTLTLMSEDGNTMTLTMGQTACEQLIRMLRATYTELEPTEGDDYAG
jgi:hypothetical protein